MARTGTRDDPRPTRTELGYGAFLIRRTRPGLLSDAGHPAALGPLAVIAMHEHRDDEMLSYVGRSALIHEVAADHRVTLSSTRLMMMNAGTGLFHEETVPGTAVDMLQVFIRPTTTQP